MTDLNVDDFFKDAARTLVALYGVFPRRQTIFVDDIYGQEEPDDFGLYSERYQACFGTLLWLGEENYLRFEEIISNEAIDQAVLTGRCFTLLSSPVQAFSPPAQPLACEGGTDVPELIRLEQSTYVHKIKQALKDRSSTELRQAMVALMSRMEQQVTPLGNL